MREALATFFERLAIAGVGELFHPHPLTREEAEKRCRYEGNDLYYGLSHGESIVGYGILRGWDDGFDVPSLGIAIDPEAQGTGYGRLLMLFLHAAARARGARRVRLKVYPSNQPALALYRSLGYEFQAESEGQLVGYVSLSPHSGSQIVL